MIKSAKYIILLFSAITTLGQSPQWNWAKTATCLAAIGNGVTTDLNGNAYVAATWGGYTINIEGSLYSDGFNYNGTIVLLKYGPDGNLIWKKFPSGYGAIRCIDIVATDNFIYLLALSTGAPYLDNMQLNCNGVTGGIGSAVIVKMDLDGNIIWIRCGTGSYYTYPTGLAVDHNGNVLTCGYFNGSLMNFGQTTIYNSDQVKKSSSIYAAKYDPAGNLIWAQSIQGNSEYKDNGATCIRSNIYNEVYISGWCQSQSLVFRTNSVAVSNAGNTNIFLAKLGPLGNYVWAKSFGAEGDDTPWSISVDPAGSAFLSGQFNSNVLNFSPVTLTNTNTSIYKENLFVTKFDPDGNVVWAKNKDRCKGKVSGLDYQNNFYVSGFLRDSTVFAGTKLKGGSLFLFKYDNNGNEIFGKKVNSVSGTNGFNYVNSFGMNNKIENDIYLTGNMLSKKVNFDTCQVRNSDTTGNNGAYFLVKINTLPVSIQEQIKTDRWAIYPNPTTGKVTIKEGIKFGEKLIIKVYNSIGDFLFSETFMSNDLSEIKINLKDYPTGIYLIRIDNGLEIVNEKIILYR